jgi:hypothetical protein
MASLAFVPSDRALDRVALWVGADSLLPQADVIVVRSPDGTLARAWADVAAACGGFAAEPDALAPYYRTAGWPSAKAHAQIAAAEAPDWARGRGVGVAAGRLTLFG